MVAAHVRDVHVSTRDAFPDAGGGERVCPNTLWMMAI